MNILWTLCFSSKFASKIPRVLSSFLHESINTENTKSTLDVLFKDVHKKIHTKLIEDLHKHYHKKKQINLLYDFLKFHHKQKAKNIKEEIYRILQKRQNIHINKGIKKFNRLKKL